MVIQWDLVYQQGCLLVRKKVNRKKNSSRSRNLALNHQKFTSSKEVRETEFQVNVNSVILSSGPLHINSLITFLKDQLNKKIESNCNCMVYLTRHTVKFNNLCSQSSYPVPWNTGCPNWAFLHPQLNHNQFFNLKSFKGLLQALLLNSNMMVFYLKTWRENSYLVLISTIKLC